MSTYSKNAFAEPRQYIAAITKRLLQNWNKKNSYVEFTKDSAESNLVARNLQFRESARSFI